MGPIKRLAKIKFRGHRMHQIGSKFRVKYLLIPFVLINIVVLGIIFWYIEKLFIKGVVLFGRTRSN